MVNKFFCLRNFPDLDSKYIEEGLNGKYNQNFKPHVFRSWCTYDESDFAKELKFKFVNVRSTWLMNPPWTLYDWHTDVGRSCSINIPIKMPDRAAAYVKDQLVPEIKTKYFKLTEVEYILNKPTILNVSQEHCVVNPTNETRIILSISFEGDVKYEDILNYLRLRSD